MKIITGGYTMKTKKNKIIISALTVGLLTSIIPTGAFAETNNSVSSAFN